MMQPNTDNDLLKQISLDDGRAYQQIFELYWYDLFKYASKKIQSEEDAREITQNVFLELWERRYSLQAINLEHFLKVCVRNKCVDFIRRKILAGKYAEYCVAFSEFVSHETQHAITKSDIFDRVEVGLRLLPLTSQQVFRLSRIEGYSTKEIASHIQLSQKSVEYHLTKALKVMRVCLKDFLLGLLLALYPLH